MKKVALISVLLLISLAAAAIQNPAFNPSPESGIIYSTSVVFKFTTSNPSLCRYNKNTNVSFDSMSGFDEDLRTIHKKTLTGLSAGFHQYYVKCRPWESKNDPTNEESRLIEFITTIPISAQIELPSQTLSEGKHKIILKTTKIPKSTPSLKYTYDGITYSTINLHGSEKDWEGFLIIPSSAGEEVGSFKFSATDLEGHLGSEIISGEIFEVDTKAPSTITSFESTAEYGQIKLEWFLEEDQEIEKINIYRSESPNVDKTKFYKEIDFDEDDDYYYDTNIKNGKTYYYRIAAEDFAGNEADLSREIQATSPLEKITSSKTTTLSSDLVKSVNVLLTEISILENDMDNSQDMINSLSDSEKEYLRILKISDSMSSAKSELKTLKGNVEAYKLTDMTKEILDQKLSSSRVKLNVIKKKVPDTFELIDSSEAASTATEDTLREAILEYSPESTPSQINKIIKRSLGAIEEKSLKINSKINVFETIYLDGTKKDYTVIEHDITGVFEKSADSKFILRLPQGSIDLSTLNVKNIDYLQEKDNIVSFETDTKQILYTLEEKIDTNALREISVSPLVFPGDTVSITGYFLSQTTSSGSILTALLLLTFAGLAGYLLIIKQQKAKQVSSDFLQKAHEVKTLQKEGKLLEANELYEELKSDYLELSESQKHKVFSEIKHLTKK